VARAGNPDTYTTLGFLAARTSRIRLGTLVATATFRAPALLIKAVPTLDVLSGGRAWLGIGAGYNVDEARAMGLDLPPTAERFAWLTELLQLAHRMWDGDESPFHAEHMQLEHPIARPRPVGSARLPVLIGGAGAQRTLRLVAEYADACNLFDIPDGGRTLTRKLEVLQQHCADVGRRYEEIERTATTAFDDAESVDQLVERCRRLAALRAQHVVLITRGRPWSGTDRDAVAAAAEQLSAA
jgi:alkanesulfonate monooxygenase SsuD/methylene tetrahydromethanopterin reductase-like flavin-dependent oxidoreductase (luciferase family)